MIQEYLDLEKERAYNYKKYKTYKIIGFSTIIIIIGFLFLLMANNIKQNFLRTYKKRYIEIALKNKYDTVSYNEKAHVSSEYVVNTGLIDKYSKVYGEDLIHGFYKSIEFSCSDLRIEKKVTGNNSIFFQGRWYIFKTNKNFPLLKIFETSKAESLSVKSFKEYKTNNEEFNTKFKIYTNDFEETKLFLTSDMLEKINKYESVFLGQIFISFNEKSFQIGINDDHNSFDFDFSNQITEESLEKLQKEINVIAYIIDDFNL